MAQNLTRNQNLTNQLQLIIVNKIFMHFHFLLSTRPSRYEAIDLFRSSGFVRQRWKQGVGMDFASWRTWPFDLVITHFRRFWARILVILHVRRCPFRPSHSSNVSQPKLNISPWFGFVGQSYLPPVGRDKMCSDCYLHLLLSPNPPSQTAMESSRAFSVRATSNQAKLQRQRSRLQPFPYGHAKPARITAPTQPANQDQQHQQQESTTASSKSTQMADAPLKGPPRA